MMLPRIKPRSWFSEVRLEHDSARLERGAKNTVENVHKKTPQAREEAVPLSMQTGLGQEAGSAAQNFIRYAVRR